MSAKTFKVFTTIESEGFDRHTMVGAPIMLKPNWHTRVYARTQHHLTTSSFPSGTEIQLETWPRGGIPATYSSGLFLFRWIPSARVVWSQGRETISHSTYLLVTRNPSRGIDVVHLDTLPSSSNPVRKVWRAVDQLQVGRPLGE